MHAAALILATFNLNGGEIILVLALILILFYAKRLPEFGNGLGLGVRAFRKSIRDVRDEVDGAAHEAGESLGGIYGKPAAEALTPDNQTAELYKPDVFEGSTRDGQRTSEVSFWRRLWRGLRALFYPCGSTK